jgi:hypothetical protein
MSLDSPLPETPEPSALSRRGLIRNAAGAGAAVAAAGVLLNSAAGSAVAAEPTRTDATAPGAVTPARADEAAQPLIVHVRDQKTGELDVFHGDQHRRVLDPALAAALRNAAR